VVELLSAFVILILVAMLAVANGAAGGGEIHTMLLEEAEVGVVGS
jgi:hypothetical protein